MNKIINNLLVIRITHWSLLVVAILFLISGFGITGFRVVETITFGLLTKNLAFRIHEVLWIPFVVLLLLHSYQGLSRKNKGHKNNV
jgi:cytochrome b subunit of formate dehydrogenase